MIENVTADLSPLMVDGKPATVLVTGATGYIGGRLIRELLSHDYKVRVLVRDPEKLRDYPWVDQVEIIKGDAFDAESVSSALEGVHLAYYLLHALMAVENFEEKERDLARIFAKAATDNKLKRIVYLGGMSSGGEKLSAHMSARTQTGEILRDSGVPTIELRAGVVIGSGSASFEMLRHLTERLPFMVTPKWLLNRIQPIAIRDVLRYLVGSATIDPKISGDYDIGGPDVFTYLEMMQQYALAAGLRRRVIIPLPVLTPKLASGWIGLVTPVPVTLARRLVESLKHEVVARDDSIRQLVPDAPGGLTSFQDAVKFALTRVKDFEVETRWSNARTEGTHSEPLPTDPDWAGGSLYVDHREYLSDESIAEVWARVEAIGGQNGYSTGTWLWELRGIMDRMIGGVGLRRGRRDPNHLMEGEALDFWRVEKIDRPHLLRLRAEMKLPGLAWLEFQLSTTDSGKTLLSQKAYFHPRGLFGHTYWWMVAPMHTIVFPSMARTLAGKNSRKSQNR
ncbi:MAG: SDR family oxidoreductase [Aquiluna sp.]|nr:SDR family oxidoreductase [Aquiluna sp.]MCF8545448.1 SDR family oxidoreductase [Aquiluna sp.]